jgi:hypothetical protein
MSHRHMGGESFRIEVTALADDDAPAIVRLRRALKCLLRSFRLKCTGVSETTPQLPPFRQEAAGETPTTSGPSAAPEGLAGQ